MSCLSVRSHRRIRVGAERRTATNSRPSDASIVWAKCNIRPVFQKVPSPSASTVGIYVTYAGLTSVLSVWYEIEHKTETDGVPAFTVLHGVHEQEVLLLDRRVPGV